MISCAVYRNIEKYGGGNFYIPLQFITQTANPILEKYGNKFEFLGTFDLDDEFLEKCTDSGKIDIPNIGFFYDDRWSE